MRYSAISIALAAALGADVASAVPFTYQGLLKDSAGGAASYDFRVEIFDATDNVFAGPLFFEDVVVDAGRFTLVIDPGTSVFDGGERQLAIAVRRGDEVGGYTLLSPRQPIRATPYAQHADDSDFAAQVAPDSVTSTELANASVTGTKLATDAVGSAAVVDGSLTSDDLAGSSVTEDELSIDAVTRPKIATAAVGMDEVDASQVQRRVSGSCGAGSAMRVVNEEGSVACETIPDSAAFWSRTGNAGTTPGTHFLGTTDAQAFEIRTRGSRHLRIEPSTNLSSGAPATANIIAGSAGNLVSSGVRGAVIAGGGTPSFYTDPEAGGGDPNVVVSHYGSIGGGVDNIAGGDLPFGTGNAYFATVGGGRGNIAAGHASVVAGGNANRAQGFGSTVSGGGVNAAFGVSSTVLGGQDNCAGGDRSVAAGSAAIVRPGSDPGVGGPCGNLPSYPGNSSGDRGTFVWSDAAGFYFYSTGDNRFEVRATGGVRFVTGINGTGVPDAGVKLDADDNAWEVLSDRDAKSGIVAVAPSDVLARLLALPIYTWHYTAQGESTRHIGPMAQDFHAAFGFNGADDRHISTIDPDGVALAAVQGVYAHFATLRESDAARIAALEAENAALSEALRALNRRLQRLERTER